MGDGWTSFQPLRRGEALATCTASDSSAPTCCAGSCAEGFIGDGAGGCVPCSLLRTAALSRPMLRVLLAYALNAALRRCPHSMEEAAAIYSACQLAQSPHPNAPGGRVARSLSYQGNRMATSSAVAASMPTAAMAATHPCAFRSPCAATVSLTA